MSATDVDRFARKTLHINEGEVPFIEMEPGLAYRLLHARPAENLIVTQIRAQPGAMSPLHRHTAPVFGYTTKGAWGHDHTYRYRPGSYIYETPGVPHRFLNGPSVSEAVFISTGIMEVLDPDSHEVMRSASPEVLVAGYFEACERAGQDRPRILE